MSRLRLRAATSPEDPIPQGTVLLALQGATVGRPNHCLLHIYMGVGQNLLLSILMGWTSIYQLFWGSLGARVLTNSHIYIYIFINIPTPVWPWSHWSHGNIAGPCFAASHLGVSWVLWAAGAAAESMFVIGHSANREGIPRLQEHQRRAPEGNSWGPPSHAALHP